MDSAKVQAVTPEGVNGNSFAISPDSQSVAAIGPDQRGYLYPINGGDPQLIPGFNQGEQPINWSADGRSLYVYQPGELPAHVYRIDVHSGQRALWKDLMPTDPAGVENIGPILLTPDAKTCVFGYHRLGHRSKGHLCLWHWNQLAGWQIDREINRINACSLGSGNRRGKLITAI